MSESIGTLSILNVYKGDIEIKFDTNDRADIEKARNIISDMLKRGYTLLVEIDGAYQRAIGFDETVGAYIVSDSKEVESVEEKAQPKEVKAKKGKAIRRRRLSIASTNAVAIARSAGG